MPPVNRGVDAVVIGAGHNGLVAAAYLARAGWSVEVLERAERAGGAIATEELTVPGYRHDTFSSWHPLFHTSGAWAELGDELSARGLVYENFGDVVTATVRADGSSVVAYRDPAKTAAALSGSDGGAYLGELEQLGALMPILGELLGTELHSAHAAALTARLVRAAGPRGALGFGSRMVSSARDWLTRRFSGPELGDLLAPWVLHTGMSPDDAGGAFPLLALAGGLHQVGMPVVRGGSSGFVDAFTSLIVDHGGIVRTGCEVERILVRGGRAAGVVAGGEEILARRAVIAGTTPTQLYGRLLAAGADEGAVPAAAREQAGRYRYGARAGMQIHLALSSAPSWRSGEARLGEASIVHVTPGLEAVSLACAQAASGLLPERPTVVCGQPTAADPSRAPAGGAIIWIQLQEVPFAPRGDAAGEIDTGDGTWTPELESAYADRVVGLIAEHVDGLQESIVGRAVLSPAELARRNVNLERGDIYSGAATLDQSYLWRPLPGYGSHRTPVPGLWQCGASTHPGPGLNAASGRIVARALLNEASGRGRRQAIMRTVGKQLGRLG
jgi:phytoene dehydrogenase-like protein